MRTLPTMLTIVAVTTLSFLATAHAQNWQQYNPQQYQPPQNNLSAAATDRIMQQQQQQRQQPVLGMQPPQGSLLGQQPLQYQQPQLPYR